ncbi:MAG: hypothetical protein AAGI54_13030 [Planctomycetota bacterium]
MHRSLTIAGLLALGVTLAVAPPSFAQSDGNAPSLDELLGLPADDAPPPADAPPAVADSPGSTGAEPAMPEDVATPVELDPEVARRLRGESMGDNPFESSLVDMTEAAERLGRQQDPGLTTQRLMQEAIDKLDRAIAAAKQQQQQGGGESSESSDQREADSGGEQLAHQQSGGQRQGAAGTQSQGSGENSGDASPGSASEAQAGNDPLAEARREWGSLPPRVRRELSEGVNERISPLYRGLTERYFEALSEER